MMENKTKTLGMKLAQARVMLQERGLQKGAANPEGWKYFELKDFIPKCNEILHEVGLYSVFNLYPKIEKVDHNGCVSTAESYATLEICDSESKEREVFTMPWAAATNDKNSPIQEMGAACTYLRRYLWLSAMEIAENDKVDCVKPKAQPQQQQPKVYVAPVKPQKAEDKIPAEMTLEEAKEHVWQFQAQGGVLSKMKGLKAGHLLDIPENQVERTKQAVNILKTLSQCDNKGDAQAATILLKALDSGQAHWQKVRA